jgi:hypothetical protein
MLSAANAVTSLNGAKAQAVDCVLIGAVTVPTFSANSDQRTAGSGQQCSSVVSMSGAARNSAAVIGYRDRINP